MTTVVFTASGSWTAPASVTSIDCQCIGEGGNGGGGVNGSHSGGSAGGGEYAEETTLAVTPGNVYNFTIGAGGTSTNTSFPGDAVTVTAHFGHSAASQSQGAGGTGSANTIHFDGGHGANGTSGTNKGGAGAGSSAGTGSAGANGSPTSTTVGGAGGTAPSGGGNGGNGGNSTVAGSNGSVPGGGGGGGGDNGNRPGGTGATGQITLTYTAPVAGTATLAGAGTLTAQGGPAGTATLAGVGTLTALRAGSGVAALSGAGTLTAHATQTVAASLSGTGTLTAAGGIPNPAAVNQWANNYGQSATFATTPPVLQSCVVPLTPAYSAGGPYSGTSTAGNWLFAIVSWTQDPSLAEVHVGVGDDIHSYWRQFPASSISGKTRTTIAYTPNIARPVGNVYVAPDGEVSAVNVLVVEISGLGPWDTLVGTVSNYAASATSLSLSHTAAGASFFIAGIGGDNTSSGQAFAPAGWTTLATQTQTDGTDHLYDNILTAAFLPSTSSTQTVSGTASAENMSGFMLAVNVVGASPIPAGGNPNWPHLIFEAAFGGGFNTPVSELTWTDITTRLWSWDETTGVQYQLGQLQATHLDLELDNFDNALASLNAASPYYPDVEAGTPLRIRAAIGTIAGVTANRWYVIQRNAQEWPEEIDAAYRRNAPATGTDVWAALSSTGPTPYRGEVYADLPYSWFPCDDQPGPGGVLPTSLLNAAQGNTTTLNIIASPSGVSIADAYSTTGTDLTTTFINFSGTPAPSVATYAVGAQSGWMYGDPESTPASALAGNQITASPGSAAWQQTGLLGSGGSNTWFLAVNDPGFPPLSGGITVKGWFSAASFGTATGYTSNTSKFQVAGQPYSPITLLELATASAPVAILQLDQSGHLNFITYSGGSGTSNGIYSSSDLRDTLWFSVDITMTATAWTVNVNGGLTASVSGSAAGMTSAWTWLIAGADLGSSGGSNLSAVQHGGNLAISHLAVFPVILPAWRLLAHYCAAITGFGLLPAPESITLSAVCQEFTGVAFTPDGSLFQGSYGGPSGSSLTSYTFSALVAAQAGSYTSGPSARAISAGVGTNFSGTRVGNAVFVGYAGLAPEFVIYTSASAGNETGAAISAGAGDSFSSGYGAGASGAGPWQVAGGTGAAPPATASALGDTVAQRIERALGYGNVVYPGRCIDQAPLLVQAALDVGGQQAGQNVQNQAISDGGLLFIDNVSNLVYWQRPHLAAQYSSPVWQIGPTTSAGRIPYDRAVKWITDPQQSYNAIEIQPYSPAGASLPIITPVNGAGVIASQRQFGAQPFQVNSYLQSTAEMQKQANWLFQFFGSPPRRAEEVKIDAATYPQAWTLCLGINIGDVVQLEDWQIGGGGNVYTYRVTSIKRHFAYGDDRQGTEASVTLQLSPEPASYWDAPAPITDEAGQPLLDEAGQQITTEG